MTASSGAGLPSSHSPALTFEVLAQCGRARASRMTLPHYVCEAPMFMPVGTQGATHGAADSRNSARRRSTVVSHALRAGSVKGLTSQQLEDLGCQVILGNTYHLENRPGAAHHLLAASSIGAPPSLSACPPPGRFRLRCAALSNARGWPVQAASWWRRWAACTASSTGRAACSPTQAASRCGPRLQPGRRGSTLLT